MLCDGRVTPGAAGTLPRPASQLAQVCIEGRRERWGGGGVGRSEVPGRAVTSTGPLSRLCSMLLD